MGENCFNFPGLQQRNCCLDYCKNVSSRETFNFTTLFTVHSNFYIHAPAFSQDILATYVLFNS